MVKKGQAAMEYLMTYGWAILVIVIVLAALLYLGVFNVGTRTPDQCNFPVGFMCVSSKLTSTLLTLTLKNGHGDKVNICKVSCDTVADPTAADVTPIPVGDCESTDTGVVPIEVGQQAQVTTGLTTGVACTGIGFDNTIGSKYRGKVYVQYIEVLDTTGNARITEGDLQATVQA